MNIRNTVRKNFPVITLGAALAASVVLISGCITAPPTRFESGLFDITTNKVVTVETNYHVIPVYQTNLVKRTVTETNYVNSEPVVNIITLTNEQRVVTWVTNAVTQSVTNDAYVYKPGAGAQEITNTASAVGNLFGVGGLVSSGMGILWGIWASMRSSKRYATAANTAQIVEGMREFIKQLPNGEAYDLALVQWMQAHQAEAGVTQQVIELLKKNVSNPDAKMAAEQVMAIIRTLQGGGTTSPASPTAPAKA